MNEKDHAAIDHVASVSKHPQAEIITKWLITGWEVKRKDGIRIDGNPYWHIDIEYYLIEPKPAKPAKPAYRVYKLTDGGTSTIDKGIDVIPDGAEWLTDWIEYDLPKKWPTPLVERIAAIDIKAAEWIVDHWDDLLDEKYTYKGKYSRDSERLDLMFDWEKTDFIFDWFNISDKLRE